MRIHGILLLLLLAMAFAWAGPAHAGTSYDNCTGFITDIGEQTTISTPGTWCFKSNVNVNDPGETAILINSDNVIIDCNDFELRGPTPSSVGTSLGIVAVNRKGITVRHCNVNGGFYKGISLEGTSGSEYTVEDNHVSGETHFGIVLAGTQLIVRRNLITGIKTPVTFTGGVAAITINGASATSAPTADLVDNTIIGVASSSSEAAIGIDVSGIANGSIARNQIHGLTTGDHPDFPIGIRAQSTTHVAIRDNDIAVGSGQTGFGSGVFCDATSTGRITNNELGGFLTAISGCGDAGRNDVSP